MEKRRRSVPAAPLRRILLGWQRWSNDDLVTMARGFGIDLDSMRRLLGPNRLHTLRVVDARALCISLRAHPQEIWARRQADRLGYVDWDTETLWSDAGVDPIIVES